MGIGHTINSVNLADFAEGLYRPSYTTGVAGQAVLQEVGDSKRNPNVGGANTNPATQWNLNAGVLNYMNLPINGVHVCPGGSGYYCGGYTNTASLTSDVTRNPQDTFAEGFTKLFPIIARDLQVLSGTGTSQAAFLIHNLNHTILPHPYGADINPTALPVTQRLFIYQTSRTHSIMNCLWGKNSAQRQDFVTRNASLNQIRVITVGTPVTLADAQAPKFSIGYRGDSPSVTLGSVNDKMVSLGGDVRWLTIGPGVYYKCPIGIGSTTAADHASENYYTSAGLLDYYTKTPTPTHLVVDLGQNLTAAESTELGTGGNTVYKANLLAAITRHLDAIEAANTANGVTAPAVKVCIFGQYRTGYTAAYNNLIADAQYDLAVENDWSFFNLYKLANDYCVAQGISVTDAQGVTGRMPTDTTFLCDGIHPNNAGVIRFTALFVSEMQTAMQQNTSQPTNGFEWLDPLELARSAGNMPEDYVVSGGVQAIASGNLELQMPGMVLKSLRGSDWLIGDGYVQLPPFVSKSTNTDRVRLIACRDGADHYYCELTLAASNTPYVFGRGGINTATYGSGTHGSAIAAVDATADILKLTRSGTTLTLYKNGASIASATITDASPLVTGDWGVKGPYSIGSIVKFGGTSGFRVGVLNPYVPPARAAVSSPRLIKYVSSFLSNGSADDTHAGTPDDLWDNGWDSYLSGVDEFIAAGGEHIWIRGTGGNTSEELVFDRQYYKGGVDNSAAGTNAMVNQHFAGYLRDTAAIFARPDDGRLGNNFLTALASRNLRSIIFHEGLPPNGREPGAPHAVVGTAWPNSNTAFDFYWLAARLLGAELSFDAAGSMDPLHAESVVAAAALARAKTYLANRKPFLESHTEEVAGGTGGTWPNNTALADGTVAWMSDYPRYLTVIANPSLWLGADDVGNVENVVIIDSGNLSAVQDRIDAANLARSRGWSVVLEMDDFTHGQMSSLAAAFGGGLDGSGLGRVNRLSRLCR